MHLCLKQIEEAGRREGGRREGGGREEGGRQRINRGTKGTCTEADKLCPYASVCV